MIQVLVESATLLIQTENKEVTPDIVRCLVEQGEAILKVNYRCCMLEYIRFTLQTSEEGTHRSVWTNVCENLMKVRWNKAVRAPAMFMVSMPMFFSSVS